MPQAEAREACGAETIKAFLEIGDFLQVSERIHGGTVDPDLEVHVWAEAVARAAHVADHLALRDGATADGEARLVRVRGREPAAVVDDDQVPVAAHPPCVDHDARSGRGDRRAVPGGDVDSLVHPSPAPAE